MLEEVLGSRAKVRVMRELASEAEPAPERTMDDLSKATSLSTGTLVPCLQQLVSAHALRTRVVGRSRVFTVNPQHPAVRVLQQAFAEEMRAIDQSLAFLIEKADEAAILYAGWWYAPSEDEKRRHTVWLLVIADPVDGTAQALQPEVLRRPYVELKLMNPVEARNAVQGDDHVYRTLIERGRILRVNKDWVAGTS